ncbi:MAG: hypothetical protein GF307_08870 [candidate division Zixibacteria bacterium]|nr:hypothetical protein [candidate division Zixibacteria bacterium]
MQGIPKAFILFTFILSGLMLFLSGLSCRPDPSLSRPDDTVDADTVYYRDLVYFISDENEPRTIVVIELGREKKGSNLNGEFWGCILRDGDWNKLDKSGKYRLLASNPAIPEGPPGVDVRGYGKRLEIDYSGEEHLFNLKTGGFSDVYRSTDNDDLREIYAFTDGRLRINDTKIDGRVGYVYLRWIGCTPISDRYNGRFTDFQRFILFGKDVFIMARDNHTDMVSFATAYGLNSTPKTLDAYVKARRSKKGFDNFKILVTNRTYDLALFRIPYGWEIELDDQNTIILAGQGYYLDNKIITGRAIIEVTGALNSKGRDYELYGICEFIK